MFLPQRQKSLKKNRKYGKIQESDRREKKVSSLETHYRHEWKHEINYADLLVIRQRLRAVAEQDKHARDGMYLEVLLGKRNSSLMPKDLILSLSDQTASSFRAEALSCPLL